MADRPTFLYRLDVVYPEGSRYDPEHPQDRRHIDWEPEGWVPEWSADPEDGVSFRWPVVRRYANLTTAKRRAKLLESYGAKVTIERSLPVRWPTDLSHPHPSDEDCGQDRG